MSKNNDLIYRRGTREDCESLTTLVNDAYDGELAHQSWAIKTRLIPIPRTNVTELLQMIDNDKYVFLLFFGVTDSILKGCINISYDSQTQIAEEYVVSNWNAKCIEVNTVLQRRDLLDFYIRRGYVDTGRHHDFLIEIKLKHPAISDIIFCTLSKRT